MSDYTPVFLPGDAIPLTASGTVTGGDPVAVSGSGTVARAAAVASPSVVGVAAMDGAVNSRVTVYGRGTVHESIADGTVTAGDQVGATNTAGRQIRTIPVSAADLGATYTQAPANVALNAALNAARGVVGVALTTASDNNRVRWMTW